MIQNSEEQRTAPLFGRFDRVVFPAIAVMISYFGELVAFEGFRRFYAQQGRLSKLLIEGEK